MDDRASPAADNRRAHRTVPREGRPSPTAGVLPITGRPGALHAPGGRAPATSAEDRRREPLSAVAVPPVKNGSICRMNRAMSTTAASPIEMRLGAMSFGPANGLYLWTHRPRLNPVAALVVTSWDHGGRPGGRMRSHRHGNHRKGETRWKPLSCTPLAALSTRRH